MNKIDKTGFLYKAMSRFRLKYTVICILLIVLFAMFTQSCMNYLLTRALGPSALDTARFAQESTSMTLTNDYTYDKASPDAKIFGYAYPQKSYMQGRHYRFEVAIEDITPANVALTMSGARATADTDTEDDPVAIMAHYTTIGGKKVIMLMQANQHVAPGDTVTGIFTQASPIILAELARDIDGSMELCPYMLDIRGIEMGSEFIDTTMWAVYLIILLVLLIRLALYYIKPERHPMFAQLDRYGDIYAIAHDIEKELASPDAQYYKNEIYTPEWLLTKRYFKYKIGKNHISGGKFKYTP